MLRIRSPSVRRIISISSSFSDILLFEVIQLGFVAIESLFENLIEVFIRAKALFAGKFQLTC